MSFFSEIFLESTVRADGGNGAYFSILGGLSWIASPFTLATTMGLVAVALEHTNAFPTFPLRMTPDQVSAGLVLPFASQAILGTGGAAAVLVLMFMSCTLFFPRMCDRAKSNFRKLTFSQRPRDGRHERDQQSTHGCIDRHLFRHLQAVL